MAVTSKFRYDLFDREIAPVLQNCSYINFPFEIPRICDEVNLLLTKCGRTFFMEKLESVHLQQCFTNSKIVLDIAWEKMNTGHWKDVDKNWRYVYTFASLFKVLCLFTIKDSSMFEIIKTCDLGLLMGAPLMKNILSRIASKVSASILMERGSDSQIKVKKIKRNPDSECMVFNNRILEEKDLSINDFHNNYLEKGLPVLLIGAISDWPALSSRIWNVDYILDKTCFRTVPIEIGSKYTDDNWTQKLMTVDDFIQKYIWNKSEHKEIGYLAQHNLFNQIPELYEDISIPYYITKNEDDVDISIYFGPGGTVSPLHYDPKHNLLAQVIGEKYIRLYSAEETMYLYPRKNSWLSNTSEVDVENPDLDSFPLFSQATYEECILKPGNLLYIPPGCWHFVRSLSTSFSISFWW